MLILYSELCNSSRYLETRIHMRIPIRMGLELFLV